MLWLALAATAQEVSIQGLDFPIPAGWERTASPSEDPDLVCELTRGDQEILFYLEDSGGRSLDGLWVALRYAVVIDWGGSILSEARRKVDGLPAQVVEFQARPEEGELRRYARALVVRGDRKLTVQASAPVAGFAAVKATWLALVGGLRWREPSSPERV